MKYLIVVLGLFFVFMGCQADKTGKEKSIVETPEFQTATFQVQGMTCEGCENAIQKAVQKLPGVKTVKASHVEQNTVVEFNANETSEVALAEAIKKTGYRVVGEKK